MTNPYSNEKNGSESNNLLYDFFKHLTTLNTGSILIIITFWQNLFDSFGSKVLVLSLVGFALSLTLSVYLMHVIAYPIKPENLNSINYLVHFLTWLSFLFGISMLTVFVIFII